MSSMAVIARRSGILRLAAVTTIGCPALTPWAASVGVGVGGASEAGSLALDPQDLLGARGYEGTHQLGKAPRAEHLSTVAVEPTGATVPLAAAATEQASHQVVGASKQKDSAVPTGSSYSGAAAPSSSPSYGASSYGAGASGAYGGAAPAPVLSGGAYGGGAGAYGATSGGAITSTKAQQCIIPMWAQNEYVCSEHSLVPKSSRWKDSNGLNRKKVDERDVCTVQCPLQKRWMAPSVTTMVCEDGEWSDVSTQETVMSIQCGTANWIYYLLLFSVVGAIYYYQNHYHVAASGSPQAAPEAVAPAAPAQ